MQGKLKSTVHSIMVQHSLISSWRGQEKSEGLALIPHKIKGADFIIWLPAQGN